MSEDGVGVVEEAVEAAPLPELLSFTKVTSLSTQQLGQYKKCISFHSRQNYFPGPIKNVNISDPYISHGSILRETSWIRIRG